MSTNVNPKAIKLSDPSPSLTTLAVHDRNNASLRFRNFIG